ncbi:IS21 family transposase, partial [Salmonella enterica subsp. enterica serovar Muenchen]|nr:IS21 family transposase [Salmonella enterica subsp. enterica serovar Muenchen]
QTYRAVLGLLSLQRKYGAERLEMACRKACQLEKPERRFIENLLRYKREAPDNEDNQITLPLEHENLRGPGYYH